MWDYAEKHPNTLIAMTASCAVIAIFLIAISWKSNSFKPTLTLTWSRWLNLLSLISPVTSLILYFWVFIVKNASSVSQLNPAGSDVWHLWASAWPCLLLLNSLSLLVIIASCIIFFQPIKHYPFILTRLFSFLTAFGSLIAVYIRFPDA